MDSETHNALRHADWAEIGLRLLRAGLASARDLGAFDGHLSPSDVEDLVSRTLEDVCSGAAAWDPSRGELYPFLKVVLKRRIIDRLRQRKIEVPLVVADNPKSGATTSSSPEGELVSVEEDAEIERKVALVFELCDGDEEAQAVLEAIMSGDGAYRPRVIAEKTGFPVARVNTVLTRIRRRTSKREQVAGSQADRGGRHG